MSYTYTDSTLMLAQADVPGPQIDDGDSFSPVEQDGPLQPGTGSNGEAGEQANGAPLGTDANGGASQGGEGNPFFLILMVGMVVLFFIFMMGGQRRERKRHQEMLTNLKKGDKVRTNAGIFGTVMEIREDQIIVKVDENTNTRLHMAPQAIAGVENSQNS